MDLNLTNKIAVVCGSTQGIGKATATELARLGASVVLVARNEDKLKEVAAELDTTHGQKHSYIVADFSKPEELRATIQNWVNAGNKVHILVNNTGGPKGGPIINAEIEEFYSAFNQHLICNHILVQALYPIMKSEGGGRIIF